jgi:hypothetical protein
MLKRESENPPCVRHELRKRIETPFYLFMMELADTINYKWQARKRDWLARSSCSEMKISVPTSNIKVHCPK